MKLSKHTILFAAGSVLGFIVLLLFWISWNQSIEQITSEGLLSASSFIISTAVFLVLALTLLGIFALFVREEKIKIGTYALWGITAFVTPAPIGIVWKILLAIALFCLFLLCDFAIQRRAALLVRPVLPLIFVPFFKLWLFGLTVLLAVHMVAHPAIALQEFDVSIPEGMWQQMWELFGIGLDTGSGGVEIQSALEDTHIPLTDGKTLTAQEVAMLEQMLIEYGINFPDLAGFLESVRSTEDGSLDLNRASEGINTAVSEVAKSQTEAIFTSVLAPLGPFWPYVVALSFFLSVQLFVPIFVYLGIFCLKIGIYVLTALNVVQLTEESTTVSRYELK